MPEEQLQQLLDRIQKLEETVEEYKKHQHLGTDGSSIFEGFTDFHGNSLLLAGNKFFTSEEVILPLVIADGTTEDSNARVVGSGLAARNKDRPNEEIAYGFVAGKSPDPIDAALPTNQQDFTKNNQATLLLIHQPQGSPSNSGPSRVSPISAFYGIRTPTVVGRGTIVAGSNVMVDSTANLAENSLETAIINIIAPTGGTLFSAKCIGNTSNTISLNVASSISGTYSYFAFMPLLLGTSNYPWERLFVSEDIRLGYGTSGGGQVAFIKWGYGSPEGVITANPGSLYLNFLGGTSTTLYVKTSGNGNTGWTGK